MMNHREMLENLIQIANEIDLLGFTKEAVSIDDTAENLRQLSLIDHKEEVEKQLVISWAQYNKVANELRTIEKIMREGNVQSTRNVRGDIGT